MRQLLKFGLALLEQPPRGRSSDTSLARYLQALSVAEREEMSSIQLF